MQQKRLDDRIAHLLDTGIANGHRSMLMLLGVNAHKQIPVLFQIYAQKCMHQPSVAWCYSDRPQFKKHTETIDQTLSDGTKTNFISQSQIRFTHYRDSEQLLGQTFSVLVLQDFEQLSPNLLAVTIETVRGGGLVIFVLNQIETLNQLQNVQLAAHKRYQTSSSLSQACVPRFTERFCKLANSIKRLLVLDEDLKVVEIGEAANINKIEKTPTTDNKQLAELIQSVQSHEDPVKSSLARLAVTVDQCSALASILDLFSPDLAPAAAQPPPDEKEEENEKEEFAKKSKEDLLEERKLRMLRKQNAKRFDELVGELDLAEKPTHQTRLFGSSQSIFVKAARGRGKSALLGLVIAAALEKGATNILLFAPLAKNIQTVFQFVETGLKQLGYQQFTHYKLLKEGDKQLDDTVGLDFFAKHRQSVRFIQANVLEAADQKLSVISLADLVVVDEAAAMPVDLLKQVLDKHVFTIVSSTVHGYEGSGRALQIKVLNTLSGQQKLGKRLTQLILEAPIRYSTGDNIERWLYDLLLLDCESFLEEQRKLFTTSAPLPADCQLHMVSRDCLFSGVKTTESFLKLLWSVFATAHYKNQPNDLLLLSDNPCHRLFVLLGPISDRSRLPMPLCVVQVSLEGLMDTEEVAKKLHLNQREDGNMVPWLLSQQYLDPEFAKFATARVVRIAANPWYERQGYGSAALQQLKSFYENKLMKEVSTRVDRDMAQHSGDQLPPLLLLLNQLQPEPVSYLSVAFGITNSLYNFWNKAGYEAVYVRHQASQDTNERSCVMVYQIANQLEPVTQLVSFRKEFQIRVFRLLGSVFQTLEAGLALKLVVGDADTTQELVTEYQLKRLDQYCKRILNYDSVVDLAEVVASYFLLGGKAKELNLVQLKCLVGAAAQHKGFREVGKELGIDGEQTQAIFAKAVGVFVRAHGGDVV